MKKYLRLLLSIPKTIFINLKIFPLKTAIHFPILVSYDTKCIISRGGVQLPETIYPAMIKIGYSKGSFNLSDSKSTFFEVKAGGRCIFAGKATICKGSAFTVGANGILEMGKNFLCNANVLCSASKRITFGNNSMCGWNSSIIDGDGHKIVDCESGRMSQAKEVKIGNHVWIGADCCILKGTEISDDTIVGYGSVLQGKYSESNVLITCAKAEVIKHGVSWEK